MPSTQYEKKNKTPFYGWIVVLVSAAGLFFSGPGQTYSLSVFIDSFIQDFDLSRSLVSSLYSAGTLIAGFAISGIGFLVDRYGHRLMFTLIAIMLGVACLWMSFINGAFMLFIGFIMMRLLGQGSMTLIPNTLVPQWFIKKRGRALSLMALGGIAASAILPPFNTWIIHTLGWRSAWRTWALLLWAIMAPLALFLTRNHPEDVGLTADNTENSGDKSHSIADVGSWTLTEATHSHAFWRLLFCSAIPSMINTGLVFHQTSIMATKGLTPAVSASVLSLMAITAIPVTFIAGSILDRVKANHMVAVNFGIQLIAMTVLLRASSPTTALAYGVVRGIAGGFESVTLNTLWPDYFGRKHLGSIRGLSMTVMVIASAAGPLPFGVAFDFFGGYTEIILAMMAFPVVGIMAALASPKPQKVNSMAPNPTV